MPDEEFRHPRLAALYDVLDPDRSDLDAYVAIATELGARRVLDVGCGTGTLALLLAERGCDVVAVDPAAASLAVARAKPGAGAVRWVEGDATGLTGADRGLAMDLDMDLATLTGNAAQSIAEPREWAATLHGIRSALRPGGHLVLETRDPAARAWEGWTREATLRTTDAPGVGAVTSWVEVTGVEGPLVGLRWTWVFAADGAVLTSDSALRFRGRDEVAADLRAAGYEVTDVRGAADRPGRELVFLARRP